MHNYELICLVLLITRLSVSPLVWHHEAREWTVFKVKIDPRRISKPELKFGQLATTINQWCTIKRGIEVVGYLPGSINEGVCRDFDCIVLWSIIRGIDSARLIRSHRLAIVLKLIPIGQYFSAITFRRCKGSQWQIPWKLTFDRSEATSNYICDFGCWEKGFYH